MSEELNPLMKQMQEADTFQIAFQPILNVQSRCIVAYEALLRGPAGISYPETIASMSQDQLRSFHRLTVTEIVRCAAELKIGSTKAALTINILPDLDSQALNAEYIRQAALDHGLSPARIILELTEDHRLSAAELRGLLLGIKSAGFGVAMDDFGAGYAGLNTLVACRPEILKLDRALVSDIDTDEVRQSVVRAFVKICDVLHMTLIAEGVETLAECRELHNIGIRYMQGFFFSRPIVGSLVRYEDCSNLQAIGGFKKRKRQGKESPAFEQAMSQTLGEHKTVRRMLQ